jgi:molybdate transport system regulatory protein
MRIMYKIWLDCDGKAFGDGPYQLLRLVDKTGSLRKAAAEMNMSYRKAWLMLNTMEERLGFALLDRKVGGVAGGGSVFRKDVEANLQALYQKYFADKP